MPEVKPSGLSYHDLLASLREQLGQDGHLKENAVSLIVHQMATARNLFRNPPETVLGLLDAMAGVSSPIPQQIVDNLLTLRQILGNAQLVSAAEKAAIHSSENQRRLLQEAYSKGFPSLREAALSMSPPAEPGEQPVTLASKIQARATK